MGKKIPKDPYAGCCPKRNLHGLPLLQGFLACSKVHFMFYFLIMWVFVDVNLSCKTIWVRLFPIFSKPTSAIPVSKKEKTRSVGRWRWTVKHPAGKRSPQFLGGGFLRCFVWIFPLKTWWNHPSWRAFFFSEKDVFNHQLDFGHANKARLTILVIYDISWPPFVRRGKLWVCHRTPAGKRRVFRVKKWKRKFETAGGWLVDRSLGG